LKTIKLTQNKETLVDDSTFVAIGHLKWYALKQHKEYYAARSIKRPADVIKLHHCVIGYPLHGLQVDHIDGNPLNNQSNNLRLVTHRENQQNRKEHRKGRLQGTNLIAGKYWIANVQEKGKKIYLGIFKTEKEANSAYNSRLLQRESRAELEASGS
jgi:hypothetical protein